METGNEETTRVFPLLICGICVICGKEGALT
jgi:hypothetical protein